MTSEGLAAQTQEYEPSRTKRLKAATREAHQALDRFITSANPFEDRKSFGTFLKTQYLFHRDLDALFFNASMDELLPDLRGRRRLTLIIQDLQDLSLDMPPHVSPRFVADSANFDLPEALGWLYVVEGSNLGAAFLLKDAAKLGLDENFGARHLSGAYEGRGLHWRTFTTALDEIELTAEGENRTICGARAAFTAVHEYARRMMI